jgi:hypothetical protein
MPRRMRKIKNITYVTLDGVMQAPEGGEDFKYAGWTFPYWNHNSPADAPA